MLRFRVNSTEQKHNGVAGLVVVSIVAFPPVHAVVPIIPPALRVAGVVAGIVIMKELGLIDCYVIHRKY